MKNPIRRFPTGLIVLILVMILLNSCTKSGTELVPIPLQAYQKNPQYKDIPKKAWFPLNENEENNFAMCIGVEIYKDLLQNINKCEYARKTCVETIETYNKNMP